MLPAHLRDSTAQRRAASIRLNAQGRLNAAVRGASRKPAESRTYGGTAASATKGQHSTLSKIELADELMEARGESREAFTSATMAATEGETLKGKAVEVPLESLIVPNRRNTGSDYEIINKCKGVIALDDFDTSSPESGPHRIESSEEEDDDDEWELLGLEDGESISKEVKPQAKSWASIVGRA